MAIVMDLYSRRIVGWSAGSRMKTALPLEALNRAIALRRPTPGLMHHSDRGSQYCAYEYRDRLKDIGAVVSMSGKGNCYERAACPWSTMGSRRASSICSRLRGSGGKLTKPAKKHGKTYSITSRFFTIQNAGMLTTGCCHPPNLRWQQSEVTRCLQN